MDDLSIKDIDCYFNDGYLSNVDTRIAIKQQTAYEHLNYEDQYKIDLDDSFIGEDGQVNFKFLDKTNLVACPHCAGPSPISFRSCPYCGMDFKNE